MTAEKAAILATSKGHQWLSLIGSTFVVFEIVFISFYSNNFWFSLNLDRYGIATILALLLVTHYLLLLLQGKVGCWLAAPFLKGKPPVVYTRWLALDESGFTFGTRHILWSCVDRAPLTFFGNLEIRSFAICGASVKNPDLVFKFPFTPAAQNEQKRFVEALKNAKPDAVLNERLGKRLDSPIVKGQNFVQAFGGAVMFLLLIDLGYSSFYYLDILKHYYQAETAAIDGKMAQAAMELKIADDHRDHPLPISYVSSRFLNISACAADLSTVRSDALWRMGRKNDAMAEAKRTLELSPDNFRVGLHYARMLEETGDVQAARHKLEELIDKHKDQLLPRLYLLANAKDARPAKLNEVYLHALSELNDNVFVNEPVWPPGGESFVHDALYSHDIHFVFDRLLDARDTAKSSAK